VFAPRFTNTWVVRVFGPASAKSIVQRAFVCRTGSSRMVAFCHAFEIFGVPLIPHWTTNPGTTRNSR
jgi:hypothetical protein